MAEPKIVKAPPICDCCDRKVRETASRPILLGCHAMLCKDCWHEWYDGGHQSDDGDGISPEKIKAAIWDEKGEFGGEANLTAILSKKVFA